MVYLLQFMQSDRVEYQTVNRREKLSFDLQQNLYV